MKRILSLLTICASLGMYAQDVQLVVESVDNQGLVPGNTFKVYAELPTESHSLHAVFGDQDNSLAITATTPFYQHPYGGNTSMDVNSNIFSINPEMAYDSWVTIERETNTGNSLWEVGVDFEPFHNGNGLTIEDGAWFLIPTAEQTKADRGNLILIAQLTLEGTATGVINLQGWDQSKNPWQARGLTFTTVNANIFGCTDAAATNFNADATYNDGTCEHEVDTNPTTEPVAAVDNVRDPLEWTIFPNPVFNGQINIQFADAIDVNNGNIVVNVFEMTGRTVVAKEFGPSNVIAGNRVILDVDMAAGTYNVSVTQGDVTETQQIVVSK